jgi:hypothetical protein
MSGELIANEKSIREGADDAASGDREHTAILKAIQDAVSVAIRTPIFLRRQNRLSMH